MIFSEKSLVISLKINKQKFTCHDNYMTPMPESVRMTLVPEKIA